MNRAVLFKILGRAFCAAAVLALLTQSAAPIFAQTETEPDVQSNVSEPTEMISESVENETVPVENPDTSLAEEGRFGAELLGVIPGKTTVDDLKNNPIFNKPKQKEVSGAFFVFTYQLPDLPEMPFIQLLARNDRIEGVVVHLEQPRDIIDARQSFASVIENIRPIVVPDDKGNFREIYPEKGFVFVLEKNADTPSIPSNRVTQIIAETVKADFFTIRAAQDLKKSFSAQSLTAIRKDAETALAIDPESASARWVIAQIAYLLEEYRTARERIVEAIRLDDSVPQYHFLLLQILNETGRIEDGLRYLKAVTPICDKPPFFKAELAILRGDFSRQQEKPNEDDAIREHRSAVELLLPLVKNKTKETRVLAKRLLMRAYLSLASDIVQKDWPKAEDKEKAFLWVDAASEIANSLVRDDGLASDVLIELCVGAVWVGLRMPESNKCDPYFEKIAALGDVLTKNCDDPLNLQYVYWKCGKGLFGAYRIAEERGESDRALTYAFESFHYLEPFCDETPRKVLSVLGPVDYDFAVLFAAKKNLQAETLACRERAVRVIEAAAEANSALDNGENGVRLTNLGKAYWTDGDRERGLSLTERGIALIESAVAEKVFEPEELIVPLRNAELMARKLERADVSQKYSQRILEIDPSAEKPAADTPASPPAAEDAPSANESAAEPANEPVSEPAAEEPKTEEPAAESNE